MLLIPEVLKEFVAVNTINDTLTVKLNFRDLGNKYKNDEYRFHAFSGVNLHFNISKFDIVNKIGALFTSIKNIEIERIKIDSFGDIFIDSCKAELIDPIIKAGYKKLIITNSDVKRINLDLDYMQNWNIDNCNVEEQSFTGSKKHNIVINRSSGIRYWIPKNKDAELGITLKGGDTTKITTL